jgi:hypothetical protein
MVKRRWRKGEKRTPRLACKAGTIHN